jgi:hypothetical protein
VGLLVGIFDGSLLGRLRQVLLTKDVRLWHHQEIMDNAAMFKYITEINRTHFDGLVVVGLGTIL